MRVSVYEKGETVSGEAPVFKSFSYDDMDKFQVELAVGYATVDGSFEKVYWDAQGKCYLTSPHEDPTADAYPECDLVFVQ